MPVDPGTTAGRDSRARGTIRGGCVARPSGNGRRRAVRKRSHRRAGRAAAHPAGSRRAAPVPRHLPPEADVRIDRSAEGGAHHRGAARSPTARKSPRRWASSRPTRRSPSIPLSHSYGLGVLLMPLLLQGTAIVLRESFVPHQLPADARQFGARVFPGVPFMFEYFVANPPAGGWPPGAAALISAGAPLAAADRPRVPRALRREDPFVLRHDRNRRHRVRRQRRDRRRAGRRAARCPA